MRFLKLIGAFLILFASPALARDAALAWTVAQKSGDVRVIRSGKQPASLAVRAALSPGDIVATGDDGRAMLTKGEDYVVVAPGSRLVLPKAEETSGFTRLMQQVGTMLYKVKRTGVPHFQVDTPMLAAVVKGTTFTIVVDQQGAAVQVTEGIVEVSALTGNARRLVEGGLTVYVGRERPNEIIDIKPNAVQLPGQGNDGSETVQIEGSGDVSLAAISTLTDGLIREAPVVAAAIREQAPVNGPPTSFAPAPLADLLDDSLTGTAPVVELAETTLPDIGDPDLAGLETGLPAITEPVVSIVGTTVPAVTGPVVDIVETTVPALTKPIVEIVQTTVPAVTQPIVEIVETTAPAVTQPIVEIVETTVPALTQPIVDIVETTVPAVTQPIVEIVETTVPIVTQPVVDVVQATVPVVTQPVIDVVNTVPKVICILLCGK